MLILLRSVIGITLLGSFLLGCSGYQLTVNERVIYTPEELFDGYVIEDQALAACVEQFIADNKITAASQLEELNCSHAGIASLQGLEAFAGLIRLKLTDNEIVSVQPLLEMQRLSVLQLEGNKGLNCEELALLERRLSLTVSAPKHCGA